MQTRSSWWWEAFFPGTLVWRSMGRARRTSLSFPPEPPPTCCGVDVEDILTPGAFSLRPSARLDATEQLALDAGVERAISNMVGPPDVTPHFCTTEARSQMNASIDALVQLSTQTHPTGTPLRQAGPRTLRPSLRFGTTPPLSISSSRLYRRQSRRSNAQTCS